MWGQWKDNPAQRIMINNILFKLNDEYSIFEIAVELLLDFEEIEGKSN